MKHGGGDLRPPPPFSGYGYGYGLYETHVHLCQVTLRGFLSMLRCGRFWTSKLELENESVSNFCSESGLRRSGNLPFMAIYGPYMDIYGPYMPMWPYMAICGHMWATCHMVKSITFINSWTSARGTIGVVDKCQRHNQSWFSPYMDHI